MTFSFFYFLNLFHICQSMYNQVSMYYAESYFFIWYDNSYRIEIKVNCWKKPGANYSF